MPRKKTQEEFIAEVKAIWGDKLDFSKVVYINNHTKIEVKCNECGDVFMPTPDNLLHHHGCPVCAGVKKMTKEMFLKRAREIHGDKYDYSKVVWIDKFTDIIITCPIHGDFKQKPKSHFYQYGCKECSKLIMGSERLSLKQFIEKAIEVHGNRYDYSLIKEFKNNREKLPIICCEHGVFMQSAHAHIDNKQGCPNCGALMSSESRRLTKEDFIKRARNVHGTKYDYSLVDYKDARTPIIIICKKHGQFKQIPYYHLAGNGCQCCYYEKRGQASLITFEEFVKRAKLVHGEAYVYSSIDYKKTKEKTKIYCKKCRRYFYQTPHNHLIGQGCPHCNFSNGERAVEMALNHMKLEYVPQYKIEYKDGVVIKRGGIYVDFYIPSKRTFIEFNGIQHYKPCKRFGGKKTYERQKKRDDILREFCRKNEYMLIEIPFTEIKNIQNILLKALGSNDKDASSIN